MSDTSAPMSYEMVAARLGEKVRALREARGLTQEALAEQAQISRNQVQNIEHSRNNMKQTPHQRGPGNAKFATIFALSQVLQVDLAYLVDPAVEVHPVPAAKERLSERR